MFLTKHSALPIYQQEKDVDVTKDAVITDTTAISKPNITR